MNELIDAEINAADSPEKVDELLLKYPNFLCEIIVSHERIISRETIMRVLYFLSKNADQTDILKKIMAYFRIIRKEIVLRNNELLQTLCENGQVNTAKWLYEKYDLTPRDLYDNGASGFKSACNTGNIEIVKWMISVNKDQNKCHYECLTLALYRNHFHIFDYIVSSYNISPQSARKTIFKAFRALSGSGSIEYAKAIDSKFNITDMEVRWMNHAILNTMCEDQDIPAVSWFVTRFRYSILDISRKDYELLAIICSRAKIEILQWLVDHFNIQKRAITSNHSNVFYMICSYGRLDLLQWVISKFNITNNEIYGDNFRILLSTESMKTIRWVLKNFDISKHGKVNGMIRYAYDSGNLKLFCTLVNQLHLTRLEVRRLGITHFNERLVDKVMEEIAIEEIADDTAGELVEAAVTNAIESVAASVAVATETATAETATAAAKVVPSMITAPAVITDSAVITAVPTAPPVIAAKAAPVAIIDGAAPFAALSANADTRAAAELKKKEIEMKARKILMQIFG
jgi:hypothetical protein